MPARVPIQMLIARALLLQEAAKAREAAMLAREERRAGKAKAREQKEQEHEENKTVNKRRRQAPAVVLAGTPMTPVTPVPVFTPVPVALAPTWTETVFRGSMQCLCACLELVRGAVRST